MRGLKSLGGIAPDDTATGRAPATLRRATEKYHVLGEDDDERREEEMDWECGDGAGLEFTNVEEGLDPARIGEIIEASQNQLTGQPAIVCLSCDAPIGYQSWYRVALGVPSRVLCERFHVAW